MKTRISALIIISLVLTPNLFAETFFLKDKSVINGALESFYEDKFVLILEKGGKQVIDKDNIEKITFETKSSPAGTAGAKENPSPILSKPNPEFSSPKKTFIYWEKAAEKGELEKMSDCFLSAIKDDQLSELKNFSKEKIKEMSKQTKKTDFSFSEPVYDGDKAYLSVMRKFSGSQQAEIVQFQKEGENWKMIPD